MSNLGSNKISFHLKYTTSFGQVVYIYGNHPLLGDDQMEQAIPMVYLDESAWGLDINFTKNNQIGKVTYHYFIQNQNKMVITNKSRA